MSEHCSRVYDSTLFKEVFQKCVDYRKININGHFSV